MPTRANPFHPLIAAAPLFALILAAIEGRAGFVVAGDSDLLDLKEYEGIRIVSPRAFLNQIVS